MAGRFIAQCIHHAGDACSQNGHIAAVEVGRFELNVARSNVLVKIDPAADHQYNTAFHAGNQFRFSGIVEVLSSHAADGTHPANPYRKCSAGSA